MHNNENLRTSDALFALRRIAGEGPGSQVVRDNRPTFFQGIITRVFNRSLSKHTCRFDRYTRPLRCTFLARVHVYTTTQHKQH